MNKHQLYVFTKEVREGLLEIFKSFKKGSETELKTKLIDIAKKFEEFINSL